MYLTKSDFRVARTCATKLYYKKLGFASLEDDDPYLEFLADGGYMLEKMARLLFPDGKEIGFWAQPEKALEATRLTVNAGDCTLFEATVVSGNLLARIDILRRDGNALQLIEVKSSSIDSDEDGLNPFRGTNGDILSDWRPYLEDVTFQTIVLTRAFPAFRVVPFLCVVNKARTATPNMTFDKFRLCRSDVGDSQWRPKVDYHGDVRQLQNEHVLAIVNVSSEFEELAGEVEVSAEEFVATLESEPIRRVRPEIGQKCKGCEYRLPRGTTEHNGFCECWGALGEFEPHVLDLYRVDLLGGKNRDVVAELAAMGQARLSNVPMNLLSGTSACRQRIQLEYTLAGREYVAPELWQILSDHPYPLHFIDFEGSRLAVPYHSGMRPYEQAAFQWSCHRIRFRGAALEHAEWLNTDDAFPNFAFARTLKDQIGDEGTVYIWSHYEVDILCEIRDQMEKYAYNDRDLAAWIDSLRSKETSRVVDLCALAKAYYFHPLMKGSLSIKKVFPAVWSVDEALRAHSCFSKYTKYDGNGRLLDPYAALPPLPVGEKEEVVTEGTGAMRLYQEMMFGRVKGDETLRQNYRKLLLQYCELDTAAMVVIWMRWASPEI